MHELVITTTTSGTYYKRNAKGVIVPASYSKTSPVLTSTGAKWERANVGLSRVEKMVLADGGEIEFSVRGNELEIYARRMPAGKEPFIYAHITKKVGTWYTPDEILDNATNGIKREIVKRETKRREAQNIIYLSNYFGNASMAKQKRQADNKALLERAKEEVAYNALVEDINQVLEQTA